MLDLDLLRSFVSVVEAGGFTRAGERVHRTQSTVSQQIRRLEEYVGKPLLHRDGRGVTPTEEGERLLSYARRILALAEEARCAIANPTGYGVVRLGIPEDFAAYRLTELLSNFLRSRPGLHLDVRSDLPNNLANDLDRQELDLALTKRPAGSPGALAAWPERLHWVTSSRHPINIARQPLPLALFPQGCLYRSQAIRALETAGRSWHVSYTSRNLTGIQAAVAAGLGIGILSDVSILDSHIILGAAEGFPPIDKTELALVLAPGANPVARRLAAMLVAFCDPVVPAPDARNPIFAEE